MPKPCPQLQQHGACSDSNCQYRHDVIICEDCGVICTSADIYQAHLRGKRHARRISGASVILHCPLCHLNFVGHKMWTQHLQSKRHSKNSTETPGVVVPEEGGSTARNEYCSLCKMEVRREQWLVHVQGPRHHSREKYTAYKAILDEAEKDKHGVTVSDGLDFGIIGPVDAQRAVQLQFRMETNVPASRIRMVEAKLTFTSAINKSSPFSVILAGNPMLVHRRPTVGQIRFQEVHNGRYDDRLELIFEDEALNQRFVIVRPLRAIVGNKADYELLKPRAPFVPRKRVTREVETDVLPGILPPALNAIPYAVKLAKSPIPKNLSDVLSTGSPRDATQRVRRMFLPGAWDSSTYGRHFKHLIWAEELRMEQDLEMYDTDAKLTKHGVFYHLEVPGLAENRPSVLVGDQILAKPHGPQSSRWFEGGVHFVRKESVGLRFDPSFRWTAGQVYNIRFKLNRIPLRRQHQALDTAFTQDRILLPIFVHVQPRNSGGALSIVNRLIATNTNQLLAVNCIVQQKPGAVPFVVFGPPGTGKTVTIVEAIQQLLISKPTARILACAPSNSAADLIASRLTTLGPDVLFRFYAPSRHKNQVPDDLNAFTSVKGDGHFTVPPMAKLKRFRVIVSTCVSASFPYGVGMSRGHFSHIFFDEAGQATEPETMIAIKTMADNATNIVLSGDPRQLGPIIRSNVARELGLEISYLERLMSGEMYDEQKAHGSTVIKLVKNFRSHNAILKYPNERFYRSELQQCGDPKIINAYIGSAHLPSKKFPVIFHSISGKDDREASSPSFFNIDEATQVKAYVEALRADRKVRLTDQDIGVIAPYHAQCLKIRAVLRNVADAVKVGSVEEFQGQERKVIIVSTVRSSREFVEYDLRHTLGFVANPRRFNVAVTRAQALLIVVGDPNVLSLDPLWRSFLNYIHVNGGWKGPPPAWDTRAPVTEEGGYDRGVREAELADMNDFTRRMETFTLAGVDGEGREDPADVNVDRPWREME